MKAKEIEKIEINLLLEAVYLRYGYDFRHYSRSSLKRRLIHCCEEYQHKNISEMIPLILHEKSYIESFLKSMSITVTEMFRDPYFYVALKKHVFPILKSYPYFKIWMAGCATGEEVYSLAILLKEENLYDRVNLYATDYNMSSIETAKEGIYPIESFKQYSENYFKAKGGFSLSQYYHTKYQSAKMDKSLKKNIIFAHHNLVSDGVFGEMNLIICRNVMIYFDETLKNRVLKLFDESLCRKGFLCLGTKESLEFSSYANSYDEVHNKAKIYQRLV